MLSINTYYQTVCSIYVSILKYKASCLILRSEKWLFRNTLYICIYIYYLSMSIKYNQPSFFQYSIIYTATISQISLPPTSAFLERDSPFQSLDMKKKNRRKPPSRSSTYSGKFIIVFVVLQCYFIIMYSATIFSHKLCIIFV